jgi:hypothetical protein
MKNTMLTSESGTGDPVDSHVPTSARRFARRSSLVHPRQGKIPAITRTLLSLFALGSLPCSAATLVGQWTFENGSLADTTGNFVDLQLMGNNVAITNGALNVNGSGTTATGWAQTRGSASYPGVGGGLAIGSKTMVSWITLQGLQDIVRAGSAMTLGSVSSDKFDGIVFAERDTNRWMNGSTDSSRSNSAGDFNQTAAVETTIGLNIVQLAITYQITGLDVLISGYRNGVSMGSYTSAGQAASWDLGDQQVIFGARAFWNGNIYGGLDALIHEARLYDGALTQAEIGGLAMVPEPSAALLGGLGMLALLRRRR